MHNNLVIHSYKKYKMLISSRWQMTNSISQISWTSSELNLFFFFLSDDSFEI